MARHSTLRLCGLPPAGRFNWAALHCKRNHRNQRKWIDSRPDGDGDEQRPKKMATWFEHGEVALPVGGAVCFVRPSELRREVHHSIAQREPQRSVRLRSAESARMLTTTRLRERAGAHCLMGASVAAAVVVQQAHDVGRQQAAQIANFSFMLFGGVSLELARLARPTPPPHSTCRRHSKPIGLA